MKDIQAFLILADHGVTYMIVGAEAVICYGYSRLTGDVDFFYERTKENGERLFRALLEFWDGDILGIGSKEELV